MMAHYCRCRDGICLPGAIPRINPNVRLELFASCTANCFADLVYKWQAFWKNPLDVWVVIDTLVELTTGKC